MLAKERKKESFFIQWFEKIDVDKKLDLDKDSGEVFPIMWAKR